MEYNFPTDRQTVDLARDYEMELRSKAAYQAELHADTGCTPEEIADRWQYRSNASHLACPVCQSQNLHITTTEDPDYDVAACLDCHHIGDVAGEFVVQSTRIQAKPVRFAETAQGELFGKEVA